jgi:hypothetical protein
MTIFRPYDGFLGLGRRNRPRTGLLGWLSLVAAPMIAAYVVVAMVVAPEYDPTKQFQEGGMITALSSLMLAAAAMAAAATFYVKIRQPHAFAVWVWLGLAAGLAFLALDDLIMIHEKVDALISRQASGGPAYFRSWNDLVVLAYGLAAVGVVALFARELWKPALVVEFLASGFAFYALHTGIDMAVAEPTAFSVIVEESAKVIASSQFLLAMVAASADALDSLIEARRA